MFINRFKLLIDKLTPTEKEIGYFIEQNLDKINNMSSHDLAKELKCGQSTIIRFSQKLGYQSFRELQYDVKGTLDEIEIEEISIDETINKTNFKIMKQYQEVAELTYSINSEENIGQAVEYIRSAKRILVFGLGNSNLFAEYFSNQLLKIGFFSICSTNVHIIYSMITKMDSNDLVILISETGETKEVIKAAELAYTKNVPIVSITRMTKNKLYDYSNVILKTVNRLSDTRLEAMTIRCSQLCVIDMVYLNLFKTDYSKYKIVIDESESLIKDK